MLSCAVATPQPSAAGDMRATGWLQLERDQRRYRERVEPLDPREERQLEVIERSQRDDLRAAQQRLERAERFDDRQQRMTPAPVVPRRDWGAERRRVIERKRLEVQMQQQGLPFGANGRR
jgi:hypothetical protein